MKELLIGWIKNMANLAEWFKRIPGFEDYYSINNDWKVHSYLKLCWPKRWWQLQEDPVSFVKWQEWVWKRARNCINVQLHKEWKRVKININTMVEKLFWKKIFLYKRQKRAKPVDDWRVVIEAK